MSMRKIYREIAKRHGVSLSEVKKDMNAAIHAAYENQHLDEITTAYQRQVLRKKKVPTADEVIFYAVSKINSQQ